LNLHLYRRHLAQELAQFPDLRSQEIQSYILTTAILARRIDDRLGGRLQSEHLALDRGRSLNFRELVNTFLHYESFYPSHSLTPTTQDEFWALVYSKKSKTKYEMDGRYRIRLDDYVTLVEKIAHDDMFVYRHLIAATSQRLQRASNIVGEMESDELRGLTDSFEDIVWLSRLLIDGALPQLGNVPLQVYVVEFEGGPGITEMTERLVESTKYCTLGDMAALYHEWWRSPFAPRKVSGWGYCLSFEDPDNLKLPFSTIVRSLAEIMGLDTEEPTPHSLT